MPLLKRIIQVLGSVLVIFLGLSFVLSFFGASDFGYKLEPPQIAIQGLQEGARVTYKIYGPDGSLYKEHLAVVHEQNNIKSAILELGEIDMTLPFVCDVTVEEVENSDPYIVSLKYDPSIGMTSVFADGLQSFGDVRFEVGDNVYESSADWAGQLENDEIADYFQDGQEDYLRFAFYSPANLDSDLPKDWRVIEVLNAPGGGFAGNDGVNQFTPTHCGSPPLSTCMPTLGQHTQMVVENYVKALQLMTEQLSAVMIDYVMIVGTFLDAKQQLETQRLDQELMAEAHKDYHVSEQMCEFGTFVKSVADTEVRAKANRLAFDEILQAAQTNLSGTAAAEGGRTDIRARLDVFRKKHCNPSDNNNGLHLMCDHDQNLDTDGVGAQNKQRMNADINYTRSFDVPLTVELDFTDDVSSDDEEDIAALARNLYWPVVFEPADARGAAQQFPDYMGARQVMAFNNVAHGTFVHLAAQKASAASLLQDQAGGAFMKALLRDFGMNDGEIEAFLGKNPSYYAQMEVLTKKIYQNPDFYTNLYDKPANIDRIGVSLDAFSLMQQRDLYESSLRREILTSLMVEEALRKVQGRISNEIISEISRN